MFGRLSFFMLIFVFIVGMSSDSAFAGKKQISDLNLAVEWIIDNGAAVKGENCARPKNQLCEMEALNKEEKIAARGCCSWHGGVCGCSPSGRAVCCDGQLSPSCGC